MFEVGDVLSRGWEDFKNNVVPLLAALIVGFLATFAVNMVFGVLGAVVGESQIAAIVVQLVSVVVGLVVNTLVQMGWLTVYLKVVRGQEAGLGDVFSQTDKLVPGIIASLIVGIAVMVGMILLVVPGVIVALMTCLTTYFIVDQNMAPIDAIKASINATNGHKMNLFVFVLAAIGITILGAIPCGLGLLAVVPMLGCAFTRIYLALSQQQAQSSAPAAMAGGYGG